MAEKELETSLTFPYRGTCPIHEDSTNYLPLNIITLGFEFEHLNLGGETNHACLGNAEAPMRCSVTVSSYEWWVPGIQSQEALTMGCWAGAAW